MQETGGQDRLILREHVKRQAKRLIRGVKHCPLGDELIDDYIGRLGTRL